jgi:hypothetical protein
MSRERHIATGIWQVQIMPEELREIPLEGRLTRGQGSRRALRHRHSHLYVTAEND